MTFRILLSIAFFVAFVFACVGLLAYGLYDATMEHLEIVRSLNVAR